MQTGYFEHFQQWRLRQFEQLRQAQGQSTTTLPVVYVLHSTVDPLSSAPSVSEKKVRFASVPASLNAHYQGALDILWQWARARETTQVVACFQLHRWEHGPLLYYGAFGATCMDDLVRPGVWAQDREQAERDLVASLDRLPLLMVVDVLVFWQQAWQRQDPAMAQWSAQPWQPTPPDSELWRYAARRLSTETGQALGGSP